MLHLQRQRENNRYIYKLQQERVGDDHNNHRGPSNHTYQRLHQMARGRWTDVDLEQTQATNTSKRTNCDTGERGEREDKSSSCGGRSWNRHEKIKLEQKNTYTIHIEIVKCFIKLCTISREILKKRKTQTISTTLKKMKNRKNIMKMKRRQR